jgi:hypothetical protein
MICGIEGVVGGRESGYTDVRRINKSTLTNSCVESTEISSIFIVNWRDRRTKDRTTLPHLLDKVDGHLTPVVGMNIGYYRPIIEGCERAELFIHEVPGTMLWLPLCRIGCDN